MDQTQYRQFIKVDEFHWWFVARRKVVQAVMRSVITKQAPLKLVDIGCGTGGMLPVLSEFGNVTVTEPEETVLAFTQQRFDRLYPDTRFVHGEWESLDLPENSFDVLSAFDVLEHCQDDHAALSKWTRWVKPGGQIILTVPAFTSLWGINDEVSHHFRRYTSENLRSVVEHCGLPIEKMTYMNMLLFPPVWLSRNVQDRIRTALGRPLKSTDFDIPPAPVNSLLERLYGWEAGWLPRHGLPFGTSVLAVLRKPAP